MLQTAKSRDFEPFEFVQVDIQCHRIFLCVSSSLSIQSIYELFNSNVNMQDTFGRGDTISVRVVGICPPHSSIDAADGRVKIIRRENPLEELAAPSELPQ